MKENGGTVTRSAGRWSEWEAKNGAIFYVCNNQFGGQWEKPQVMEVQDQEYYRKGGSGVASLTDKMVKAQDVRRQHEVMSLGKLQSIR